MLKLKEFEFFSPYTCEELFSLIKKYPEAKIIAGGTDLIPKIKRGQIEPNYVISILYIKEFDFIKIEENEIRIGALKKLRELEKNEEIKKIKGLHIALKSVATPIIRNSATIGGNLLQDTRCKFYDKSKFWREALGYCLKKGDAECRVAPGSNRCFAVFCSDIAPILIALDSEVVLIDSDLKEQRIKLEEIYRDDGINHINLNGKILKEIIIPREKFFLTYKKLRIRDTIDFPEAGVAVVVKKESINIAISGISSSIFYLKEKISGSDFNLQINKLIEEVYNSIKPMDNLYFPPLYRKKVVRNFLVKAFKEFNESEIF